WRQRLAASSRCDHFGKSGIALFFFLGLFCAVCLGASREEEGVGGGRGGSCFGKSPTQTLSHSHWIALVSLFTHYTRRWWCHHCGLPSVRNRPLVSRIAAALSADRRWRHGRGIDDVGGSHDNVQTSAWLLSAFLVSVL